MSLHLNRRPVIVAIAGPNGAGKSTFFAAHIQPSALRFVNADEMARELNLGPYEAANLAGVIREELVVRRESFVFETVLSDPTGAKIDFLRRAAEAGYTVILCYIGLETPAVSDERVAMRVMQGGHDVPVEKLVARFPRTLANLARAIRELPLVFVYDNSDLSAPFRLIAEYQNGELLKRIEPSPSWFRQVEAR